MRFKGLDLNLLVVLDALLAERNVSRAGDRLNLSQSATSGALARLRDYFDDELLVVKGREMVPTNLGATLASQVRNALLQIDGTIISRPGFDHRTSDREFRIIASDYVMVSWLGPIIENLSKEAPGLRFRIEPPAADPTQRLDSGAVDFLLMPDKYVSDAHPHATCFEDGLCVIACANNARVSEKLTIETLYDLPHVEAVFPTILPSYNDWFARQSGRERRVVVMAGGFAMVPFFVVGTDRIAIAYRRLARRFAQQMPLKIVPVPFDIPKVVQGLQWHRHADEDEGIRWLRGRLLRQAGIDQTDS